MNKMKDKPNCYECQHREKVPGSCHSSCSHPSAVGTRGIETLGIKGNDYGIRNGWFVWPYDFDPTWLISCNGFTKKEANP